MENNGAFVSLFSTNGSDNFQVTAGHGDISTSQISNQSWLAAVVSSNSARLTGSSVFSPPYRKTNRLCLSSNAAVSQAEPAESTRMFKRMLHSRSPLTSIENLPRTTGHATRVGPMKVGLKEDDVLVMDELLVRSKNRVNGSGFDKDELCPIWEEAGVCRYGAMCQFAHGMEELYGSTVKLQPEVEKSANSKPTFGISTATAQGSESSQYALAMPAQQKKIQQIEGKKRPPIDEDEYNNHVAKLISDYSTQMLYGPSDKKRLSVFVDICPE